MDTFDMVVISNLHYPCLPLVSRTLPVYPASFISLTFLVFFLTMICLYECNGRWCHLLIFCHWHSLTTQVCLCPEGTCPMPLR